MKPRYHSYGNIIACRWNVKWPESITTGSERTARSSTAPRDLRLTVLCFAGSANTSHACEEMQSDEDDTVKRSPSFNQKTLPDKAGPTTSGPKAPCTQRTNRQCQANGLVLWCVIGAEVNWRVQVSVLDSEIVDACAALPAWNDVADDSCIIWQQALAVHQAEMSLDRKLALELAEKQMLIKEAEEEAAKEREIEEAAKAAAALAHKQKLQAATTGANPFSTGGRVYQPGVFVCDERSGHKPQGAVSFMPSAQDWLPPGTMLPAGFQGGQPQFRQLGPVMLGNEQLRMKMPATFMPGGPGAPVHIPPRERSRSRERQGGWEQAAGAPAAPAAPAPAAPAAEWHGTHPAPAPAWQPPPHPAPEWQQAVQAAPAATAAEWHPAHPAPAPAWQPPQHPAPEWPQAAQAVPAPAEWHPAHAPPPSWQPPPSPGQEWFQAWAAWPPQWNGAGPTLPG
ncbi:unnamed protein product [Symbiodinium sp. KB8]|nr:unnamed protein product [Symbiodinium sp. KB8]